MTATPLVLLSGLLCDARLWHHQVAALVQEVDIHIPDLTRDASVQRMAERVLDEVPGRFVLGGLSMGGYVALEIMRRAPDRVAKLALIATMASPDSIERAAFRRDMLALVQRGHFRGVTPSMLPRLIHSRCIGTPVADLVQDMARSVGKEGFIRQQQAVIGRPDYRPLLSSIRIPTVIVVGAQDEVTPPAESELMHRDIAGSSLTVLSECGHLPPLEWPEKTTALLRTCLST